MAAGSSSDHDMYHVPQQSRREKLRFSQEDGIFAASPHNFGFCTTTPSQQTPFSLSLSSSPTQAGIRQQLPPFTGYAEILGRSRFLAPARELLEEICSAGGVAVNNRRAADPTAEVTRGRMDGRMVVVQPQGKKTRLISMIDEDLEVEAGYARRHHNLFVEIYQRYKLYYQQVQAVITSFESVPGLGSATPYAFMALKVMSKHFKCLKNVMSDQLDHVNKGTAGKEGEESSGFGLTSRAANINYGTMRQLHIWRPQRGLPEQAVAVLRSWLYEHFLHPYPTDNDKLTLAKQTGLTRNQVSNWFINARVRLWKPMVEEIHSLEICQQNKAGSTSDTLNATTTDKQYSRHPSSSTATSSNEIPPPRAAKIETQSSKRPHDDLTQMTNYNPFYDGFDVRGNGGVSLTLGLHQNNGICLTEQIPLNVHQFGISLDECNDPYVIGSFGGQDHRQFEKEIGGHLLHDFVGEALL